MSKRKWRDASSWSQSDSTETRKTPKAWEVELSRGARLSVHRHIYLAKDVWEIVLLPWGISLGTTKLDADAAKDLAVTRATGFFTEMAGALGEVTP